jgi:hypothetical protein
MEQHDFSFDVDAINAKASPKDALGLSFDPNVESPHEIVESAPQKRKKPNSTRLKTSVNVFRSFVGLGILALPYAFAQVCVGLKKSGLWLSIVLLCFTTWISYYGVALFLDIADDLSFNGAKVEDLSKLAGGRFFLTRENLRKAHLDFGRGQPRFSGYCQRCIHNRVLGLRFLHSQHSISMPSET